MNWIATGDDEKSEANEEEDGDVHNFGLHTCDDVNQPDAEGRVLVNVGHPAKEDDIFLAPQLARAVKPHQIGGIRFLYDNVVESQEQFSISPGFGCILAHSMGLGKTFQVCFFHILSYLLYILLRTRAVGSQTFFYLPVLVVIWLTR